MRQSIEPRNEYLRQHPNSPIAWKARGLVWAQDGEWAKAVADFNRALELAPDDASAFAIRGWFHSQLGDLEAAMNDVNTSIRFDPAYARAYYERGCVHLKMQNTLAALDDFNRAIQLQPTFARGWKGRARARYALGEHKLALADLDETLRLDPRLKRTYHKWRYFIHLKLGNISAATRDLDLYLAGDPNNAWALNMKAWQLATDPDPARRDGVRAIAFAQRACELTNWQDWWTIDTLAAAYAETGDFVRAIDFEMQALTKAESAADRAWIQGVLADFAKGQPKRDENFAIAEQRSATHGLDADSD